MAEPTAPVPRDVVAAVAGRTHPGQRREENQDMFLIADLDGGEGGLVLRPGAGEAEAAAAGVLPVGERGALLLVADGMGGSASGRLASGLACTFILAQLHEAWRADEDRTPSRFAFRLREAVETANRRVHEHARRNAESRGMGTTATVAGVLNGVVYLAQVGDSRACLLRAGAATQLTRDQSFVQQMVDAGALSVEEASRSSHGHLVLQALGVEPEIDVVLTYQELRRGDWLLLCSDGLHRVVTPAEMVATATRLDEPAAACEELVVLANARGGPDNVSVVAARLDGAGLPSPRPWDAVAPTPFDPLDPTAAPPPTG